MNVSWSNKQTVNVNNLVYSTSIPTTSTHTGENKMYTVYNIVIRIQGYKHVVPKRFSISENLFFLLDDLIFFNNMLDIRSLPKDALATPAPER